MNPNQTKPDVILSNRLYVPKELVTEEHKRFYTYQVPNPELHIVRRRKPVEGEEEAEEIPPTIPIYTFKEYDEWVGFARGDLGKLHAVFGDDFNIVDQRALVPFDYALKTKDMQLSADQKSVWQVYMEFEYGMLVCPARWGKTTMMTFMISSLKQKSLILADENTLLRQFESEMRLHTNVNELEEQHGIKLIGQLENYDDVFPIATFASWQTLFQDAATPARKKNRDAYGMVFIDEAHTAAAKEFSRVISSFNPQYRVPVTATPTRKDGRHVIVFDIAGPVVVEGEVEGLPVVVHVVWTKHMIKPFSNWSIMLNRISKDVKRNKLIAGRVVADYRDGRCIVVTTEKPSHGNLLKEAIAEIDDKIPVALVFGETKGDRDEIKRDIMDGKYPITIAGNRIVQKGWNVKRWDTLHNALPMANEQNWYQRISRPRTKCDMCPGVNDPECLKEGFCLKKPPKAVIYADPGIDGKGGTKGVTFGCLNTMNRVHTKQGFKVITEGSEDGPAVKGKVWKPT